MTGWQLLGWGMIAVVVLSLFYMAVSAVLSLPKEDRILAGKTTLALVGLLTFVTTAALLIDGRWP